MNYANSPCCYFYLILNNIKVLLVKLVKMFLTFHSISRVVDVFASKCNSSAPSVQRNRTQIHILFPFVYPPTNSYASKRVAFFQFPTRILYPHLASQRNGLNITVCFAELPQYSTYNCQCRSIWWHCWNCHRSAPLFNYAPNFEGIWSSEGTALTIFSRGTRYVGGHIYDSAASFPRVSGHRYLLNWRPGGCQSRSGPFGKVEIQFPLQGIEPQLISCPVRSSDTISFMHKNFNTHTNTQTIQRCREFITEIRNET